jgi:hypothetical protein
MKKWIKILLIASLTLNFVMIGFQLYIKYVTIPGLNKVKEVDIPLEKNKFISLLDTKFPRVKSKKYIFIQIWETDSGTAMEQMMVIDSIMDSRQHDYACVFLCPEKNDYANKILKQQQIKTKNFVYLNEMEDIIIALHQDKNIKLKNITNIKAPVNVIIDKTGRILFWQQHFWITGLTAEDVKKNKSLNYGYKHDKQFLKSLDSIFVVLK